MNKITALYRINNEIKICKAKFWSLTGRTSIQLKRLNKLYRLLKEVKKSNKEKIRLDKYQKEFRLSRS